MPPTVVRLQTGDQNAVRVLTTLNWSLIPPVTPDAPIVVVVVLTPTDEPDPFDARTMLGIPLAEAAEPPEPWFKTIEVGVLKPRVPPEPSIKLAPLDTPKVAAWPPRLITPA